MKRVLALGMAMAALLLCACTHSGVNQMGQTLDNWAGGNQTEQAPEPIDVQVYKDADLSSALGIEVISLPDESEMTANKFFALDGWFAQIEFTTADDLSLNVRLAKADAKRLATTYSESHVLDKQTMEIDGLEVTVASSPEGCALASWRRGDIQYVMHSNTKQGVPPTGDIELMVMGLDSIVADENT